MQRVSYVNKSEATNTATSSRLGRLDPSGSLVSCWAASTSYLVRDGIAVLPDRSPSPSTVSSPHAPLHRWAMDVSGGALLRSPWSHGPHSSKASMLPSPHSPTHPPRLQLRLALESAFKPDPDPNPRNLPLRMYGTARIVQYRHHTKAAAAPARMLPRSCWHLARNTAELTENSRLTLDT